MSKISPNDSCPCGSDIKYKKCCGLYLSGEKKIENAEVLLRSRYVALVKNDAKFLWDSYHPESPVKRNSSWAMFVSEQNLLKNLNYQKLTILDGDVSKKEVATIVFYVKVFEGNQDLSYLEEAQFKASNGTWYYFDGLRRSSNRVGAIPESIKLGELATLSPQESELN